MNCIHVFVITDEFRHKVTVVPDELDRVCNRLESSLMLDLPYKNVHDNILENAFDLTVSNDNY